MNSSFIKPLSIFSAIAYIAGIIVTAFYFFRLPGKLIEHSAVLHMDNIREIQPALNTLLLVIGLTLTGGLVALALQIVQSNSQKEANVEKFKADTSKKAQDKQQHNREEQSTGSSLSQGMLEKIKEISADQENPDKALETALRIVCKQLEASQGAIYVARKDKKRHFIEMRASYAFVKPDSQPIHYDFGEGLPGQAAKEGKGTIINSVPDGYIKILSGLGQASPKNLILSPVIAEDTVIGLVEIASFTSFSQQQQELTQQAFAMLVDHFNASSLLKLSSTEPTLEEMENNGQNQ